MPITLTTSSTDRIIIAVAEGELTFRDLAECFRKMLEAHVMPYRKILVVSAAMPVLSDEELGVFSTLVREARVCGPRGALAIVADQNQGEFAHAFATLAGTDRPVKVFRSIHEARAWLAGKEISPLSSVVRKTSLQALSALFPG